MCDRQGILVVFTKFLDSLQLHGDCKQHARFSSCPVNLLKSMSIESVGYSNRFILLELNPSGTDFSM